MLVLGVGFGIVLDCGWRSVVVLVVVVSVFCAWVLCCGELGCCVVVNDTATTEIYTLS